MAEGHAVVRWAREIRALVGEELVDVAAPPRWRERGLALVGARVDAVSTIGKHLLIDCGAYVIHCHAMQYGSWQVGMRGMAHRKERRYVRLQLVTSSHEAVFFHGPVMEILTRAELDAHPAVTALGPDLLHEDFDRAEVARRLRNGGADDRAIGDAILDQHVVAGIGNIYKSEGLFLAAIDPRRTARDVTDEELERLWDALVPLMHAGTERYGRTTTLPDELRGDREYNWVYRRRRRSCFRCGAEIAMVRQGELARATYFCSGCQR
jgi:formamidopyrimidine-DNA glycosylase